jgi:hypothetical protein
MHEVPVPNSGSIVGAVKLPDTPSLVDRLLLRLEAVEQTYPASAGLREEAPQLLTNRAPVEELQKALQVGGLLLADAKNPPDLSALQQHPGNTYELQDRISGIVIRLLDALDIQPRGDNAALLDEMLLRHLVGSEALANFHDLGRWLREFREHWQEDSISLKRLIVWVMPRLVAPDGCDGYTHHLSFRLFLRQRLGQFCRDHNLSPIGGDLRPSLARLTPVVFEEFLKAVVDADVPAVDTDDLQKYRDREASLADSTA